VHAFNVHMVVPFLSKVTLADTYRSAIAGARTKTIIETREKNGGVGET
jgi:hypothetical protein